MHASVTFNEWFKRIDLNYLIGIYTYSSCEKVKILLIHLNFGCIRLQNACPQNVYIPLVRTFHYFYNYYIYTPFLRIENAAVQQLSNDCKWRMTIVRLQFLHASRPLFRWERIKSYCIFEYYIRLVKNNELPWRQRIYFEE